MKTLFANTSLATLFVAGILMVQPLSAQETSSNKAVLEAERVGKQFLSTSQTATPSATAKLRAFFASEQSKTNTSQWNLDIETLKNIAPELVQARTEYTGTPHARMPHFRTEKTVYSVDNTAVTQLLVKAFLEQQSEIERLRNEVVLMKAQTVK
jgi:hypothetical protein